MCCDPDKEEYCYEEDYGDYEPSYVIRRLMLVPKQKRNTQLQQLFRTRCTIGVRVFDLIVDSGSSENNIGRQVIK